MNSMASSRFELCCSFAFVRVREHFHGTAKQHFFNLKSVLLSVEVDLELGPFICSFFVEKSCRAQNCFFSGS